MTKRLTACSRHILCTLQRSIGKKLHQIQPLDFINGQHYYYVPNMEIFTQTNSISHKKVFWLLFSIINSFWIICWPVLFINHIIFMVWCVISWNKKEKQSFVFFEIFWYSLETFTCLYISIFPWQFVTRYLLTIVC